MFDYYKAIEELEQIAEKVEDPAVSLEEIDKYLVKSKELAEQCRKYLRTMRDQVEQIET